MKKGILITFLLLALTISAKAKINAGVGWGYCPQVLKTERVSYIPNSIGYRISDGRAGFSYFTNEFIYASVGADTSARLGVYRFQSAESFIHDYLFPQENANRCDVRWLKVGGERGVSVTAAGTPFEMSVHPYTKKMLYDAAHSCELERTPNLTVNIDGRQQGVGGDVPAIATLKKPYKIPKYKKLEMKVILSF